jgi:fluoride exporter
VSTHQELTLQRPEAARAPSGKRSRFDVRELAAIFLGGIAGALLRVWLGRQLPSPPGRWPWATFAINVSGTLMLGWLATRLQERLPLSTYRRPLLGTGFCGAYTTFSTMQVQALSMIEAGHASLAIGYAFCSILVGYVAVWIATAASRRARRLR